MNHVQSSGLSDTMVNKLFKTDEDTIIGKDGTPFHINSADGFIRQGNFSKLNDTEGFDVLKMDVDTTGMLSGGVAILNAKKQERLASRKEDLNRVIAEIHAGWNENIETLSSMSISTALDYSVQTSFTAIIAETNKLPSITSVPITNNVFNEVPFGKILDIISNEQKVELMQTVLKLLFFIKDESTKNLLSKAIITIGVLSTMTIHESYLKTHYRLLSAALNRSCNQVCAFIATKLLHVAI